MKKKFIKLLGGLVLVLVLIVLVVPVGVGMMAEGRYKQVWQDMLAAEPGFQAEVTAFERGWFQSRAEVALSITDATAAALLIDMGWAESADGGERAVLRLQEGVHHGPVPFTAPAPLWQRWRPGFAVIDSRLEENLPAIAEHGVDMSHTVHLGLTGRMSGHFRVAPFDMSLEDGLRVSNRDEVTAEWRSNRHFDRVDMRMRGGQLDVSGDDGVNMRFENPWMQVSQRRGPEDIWLGGSEFRLASLTVSQAGSPPGHMADLVWSTTAGESDGLIDQEHEISIASLSVEDFEAGPAEMKLDFYRLDPGSLSALQRAISNWSEPDPDAMMAGEDVFEELRDPLVSLATYQPGVRIDRLHIALPGGNIDGEGFMELVEMNHSQVERHLEEGRYAQMLQAEARLGAGRDLARRALAYSLLGQLPEADMEADLADLMDMQLNAAVAEGMLTETDDGFEVHLRLENGVFEVNGREILRF